LEKRKFKRSARFIVARSKRTNGDCLTSATPPVENACLASSPGLGVEAGSEVLSVIRFPFPNGLTLRPGANRECAVPGRKTLEEVESCRLSGS
jgi:hypothetical protein